MKKIRKILYKAAAALSAPVFALPVSAASVDLNAVYPISTNDIQGWPAGPEISSDTGILMEAQTGTVVYDKGADELRYPASITKLMTLLVAVENSSLDDMVTFTETGVRDVTPDSGNIGMQLGETMSMEDCLYAMIIYSANEVSAQIAEYVGGTEENFIAMMNERAAEIGCTNTNFVNASGLPDENQYTTARDMALIFREGLKNDIFRKIIGTPTYYIEPTNLNSETRKLHTHIPLFAEESALYYEGCLGGKSGMTNDAGYTLVTGVRQNGVTYIAVVMRGADMNQVSMDSRLLYDYGFQNFQKTEYRTGNVIIPSGTGTESVTVREEEIDGRNREGYYLGDYRVGIGNVEQAAASPTPTPQAEEAEDANQAPLLGQTENSDTTQEPARDGITDLAKFLFIIMGVMVVILVILLIALVKKNKKAKKKRK